VIGNMVYVFSAKQATERNSSSCHSFIHRAVMEWTRATQRPDHRVPPVLYARQLHWCQDHPTDRPTHRICSQRSE